MLQQPKPIDWHAHIEETLESHTPAEASHIVLDKYASRISTLIGRDYNHAIYSELAQFLNDAYYLWYLLCEKYFHTDPHNFDLMFFHHANEHAANWAHDNYTFRCMDNYPAPSA